MAGGGVWGLGKIGGIGGVESDRLVGHGALDAVIHGLSQAVGEVEHDPARLPGGFEVGLGYQQLALVPAPLQAAMRGQRDQQQGHGGFLR